MTEDEIFDATRQSPATLLRRAYEGHQVLVLSMADHDNERQYRALNALLEQVGRDRRLKYIVLERFQENAPVLEATSVVSLDPAALKQEVSRQFPPDRLKTPFVQISLCDFREWAYTWAEVMPRIRALNARRPTGHKVLVTAVDGASASLRASHGIQSYERDSMTAARFHEKIWRQLQRDTAAKVIVVYHIGHTIRGFTAPRGGRTMPVNFLGIFLQAHPEARPRTALLMIDGWRSTEGDARYQFKFTERQVGRLQGEAFGVPTAPFRDVAAEWGDSVLTSHAVHPCITNACAEGHHSTATLAEMVDGIIWLAPAEQRNLNEAKEYLPMVCAP